MKRLSFVWLGLALVGCANAETTGSGGTGGTGTTTSASTTEATTVTVSTASSTGTGGPCTQDCTTIEVPECYEATCNSVTHTCEIKPSANDTPCEDGLFCTVDDTCQAGICTAGGPKVCTGDGADPCLTSACDEDEDTCEAVPAANGTACTSLDPCEDNAICQNGHCLGAPKDCSATVLPDDCHEAGCDSMNGGCIVVVAHDGESCVLGDPCESNKTCSAGVCSGTPITGCTTCAETEDNGTIATANVDAACSVWQGSMGATGDSDYYGVHVAVGGSRIDAEVNDLGGPGTCPSGLEPEITLYDASGAYLDDASFDGFYPCAHLDLGDTGSLNLPAGDYFLQITNFATSASTPYLLTVAVDPPGCGNDIIENTEECDGAALGGNTCVSQGFGSGTLLCDASCNFDTSGCNLPGCGDGLVQPGEECDDGNTIDTDGCDSLCQVPACPIGQTRVSVGSTLVPLGIADNTTFDTIIPISQSGLIQSLYVMMDITHTYDGDLDISLAAPGVALPGLDLTSDNGNGEQNFVSTLFGTTATTSITTGSAPFTGLWLPEASLSGLVGTNVNGNWTLRVTDDAGGDIGTLNQWRIIACVQ